MDPGAAAARLPPLRGCVGRDGEGGEALQPVGLPRGSVCQAVRRVLRRQQEARDQAQRGVHGVRDHRDRKSTRLNSSHGYISYAVFCLKKKKKKYKHTILVIARHSTCLV